MAMLSIILTKDVENLGRAGELVSVKPGYGRNYLIPRGLALIASRGNVAQMEHHRRSIAREQERIQAEHTQMATRLGKASVSIARKVGQDGKLFGSVTARDIADALSDQNIVLDRRLIRLNEPIRATGTFEVPVRFSASVEIALKVNVIGV